VPSRLCHYAKKGNIRGGLTKRLIAEKVSRKNASLKKLYNL